MIAVEFPVAADKVFLTGNSMGGKGTFEIAMRMPEMFRAIAPTAAKIADQVRAGGESKIVCNLTESSVYSVEKNLADMPVMVVQGNEDTTTSFKVQVGGPTYDGMYPNHVMPYLNDATYIVVESGNHPQSYGAALPLIFDFFEKQLDPDADNHAFHCLYLSAENGDVVWLDETEYRLDVPAQTIDGTVMIAVSELQKLYGEDFRLYFMENYNADPANVRRYYTLIHANQTLNFMTAATANPATDADMTLYRRNMERYLEDGLRMSNFTKNPEPLAEQPHFSVAPFEADGEIFLPAVEALTAIGETAIVR